MKKYAFIDTPREEIINLPNYAFIDRLQTGFYGPPPLYDYQNEFSQNISPPAYSMGLPPPYHPKDPNRIKRRKLREFTEEYYLPSHSDIEEVDYFGPECMCVKCAISNGQIISTPGVRCNNSDYSENCIGSECEIEYWSVEG